VVIVVIAVMAATMPAVRPVTLFSLTNRLFTSFVTCRPLSWYQRPIKLVGTRKYGIFLTTKTAFVAGAGAGY
jgi:hypothetical protein